MKIREKKQEMNSFNSVSRSYTRYLIWVCFAEFWYYSFNVKYLNDHDKYVKIYNEYLTLKKLNLKENKSD